MVVNIFATGCDAAVTETRLFSALLCAVAVAGNSDSSTRARKQHIPDLFRLKLIKFMVCNGLG